MAMAIQMVSPDQSEIGRQGWPFRWVAIQMENAPPDSRIPGFFKNYTFYIFFYLQKNRLRRDFHLYFLEGNVQLPKIFRLRRIFLCISLREMSNFQNLPASGGFPLYSLKGVNIPRIPRLRRIFLCISLRKISKFQKSSPPVEFPLCFLKGMSKIPKIFRLRRIPLCVSLRKMSLVLA